MGRLLLCVGEYAKEPYYFQKLNTRVYSIEELCYVLKGNALLLDNEVMSRKLVKWIEHQCALEDLAKSLYPMVNNRVSLSTFVTTIFEYTGYYDEKIIKRVGQTLKEGINLSAFEKKKLQIDYMLRIGKYRLAATEYSQLISMVEDGQDVLKAKLYHNKGVALAKLFLYEQASEAFLTAYELDGDVEHYIQFLGAKRLEIGDDAFFQFVASTPESYDSAQILEKRVRKAIGKWGDNEVNQKFEQLLRFKKNDILVYYEELEKVVRGMKKDYRVGIEE